MDAEKPDPAFAGFPGSTNEPKAPPVQTAVEGEKKEAAKKPAPTKADDDDDEEETRSTRGRRR